MGVGMLLTLIRTVGTQLCLSRFTVTGCIFAHSLLGCLSLRRVWSLWGSLLHTRRLGAFVVSLFSFRRLLLAIRNWQSSRRWPLSLQYRRNRLSLSIIYWLALEWHSLAVCSNLLQIWQVILDLFSALRCSFCFFQQLLTECPGMSHHRQITKILFAWLLIFWRQVFALCPVFEHN